MDRVEADELLAKQSSEECWLPHERGAWLRFVKFTFPMECGLPSREKVVPATSHMKRRSHVCGLDETQETRYRAWMMRHNALQYREGGR